MTEKLIMVVGLVAQLGFTSRVLVQWILSEKAKKSLSPTIFWNLSLMSSIVFMIYGILREDIIIISGQLLSYFIYIRNLQLKKFWARLPLMIRISYRLFSGACVNLAHAGRLIQPGSPASQRCHHTSHADHWWDWAGYLFIPLFIPVVLLGAQERIKPSGWLLAD